MGGTVSKTGHSRGESCYVHHLKKFTNGEGSKQNLLLAVQWREKLRPNFGFCYWIPSEIISLPEDMSLLRTLGLFAEMFGIRIKIADTEDKFIYKSTVSKLEPTADIFNFVEVLGSPEVPCHLFTFYNERSLGTMDLHYSFAVNTHKYLSWLHGYDQTTVSIPLDWERFLEPIIDLLWLDRHVRLKVLHPHQNKITEVGELHAREGESINVSTAYVDVRLPRKYKFPVQYLVSQLEKLSPGQKIAVIPLLDKETCAFCSSDQVSREHVFPVWLLKRFEQLSFRPFIMVSTESEGFNLLEAMKSQLSVNKTEAITTRSVCKKCNETWMSQLEEQAKSVLVGSDGNLRKSLSLSNVTSEILARWLFKIALLLPYGLMQQSPHFPLDFYKDLKDGILPAGFLVELGITSSHTLNFDLADRPSAYKLNAFTIEDAKRMSGEFMCCCIQIGHLLFRLSFFPPQHVLHRLADFGVGEMKVIYANEAELRYFESSAGREYWSEFVLRGFELYALSILTPKN